LPSEIFFAERAKSNQNSLLLIDFLLTGAFADQGSTVNASLITPGGGCPLLPRHAEMAAIFFWNEIRLFCQSHF
jgi:hypothetical protein